MHDEKTSSIAKFQNLIEKTIFVCSEKAFTSYVATYLHAYLQKKQYRLKIPMSVEVQVGYYINVEGTIGILQILLVFLEH